MMKTKTAYMGLMLAFALILSYIETLLPFSFGIPGIKLGLSNVAVLMSICLMGYGEGAAVAVLKAVLTSFLFGSLSMLLYSLSGVLFSYPVMALMVRSRKFHIPVISGTGGVFHNLGQLLAAYLAVEIYGLWYYVPILMIAGLLTGLFTGSVAALVIPYGKRMMGGYYDSICKR